MMNKLHYNAKDLSGQKFGRLTVKYPTKHKNRTAWVCECDCGNSTIVLTTNLLSKSKVSTKSCGCIQKEALAKIRPKSLTKGKASENAVFSYYKRNAKKRNIAFSLSKEEFIRITQLPCYYCGESPKTVYIHNKNRPEGKGKGTPFIYNGLDRVDNNQGYVINNIVACCKFCNIAKGQRTLNEFNYWIAKIYKNRKI